MSTSSATATASVAAAAGPSKKRKSDGDSKTRPPYEVDVRDGHGQELRDWFNRLTEDEISLLSKALKDGRGGELTRPIEVLDVVVVNTLGSNPSRPYLVLESDIVEFAAAAEAGDWEKTEQLTYRKDDAFVCPKYIPSGAVLTAPTAPAATAATAAGTSGAPLGRVVGSYLVEED